ncbi:dynactin subunit 2-A [Octopus bimaculoides]|uniref:dynactin subunit 2-A n=1 Tax=Octopus bimaculoides TaxID=37653 RepID=UPI0022E8F87B|nr:dynactin subunit 2-A [Octopus bimaculoides]
MREVGSHKNGKTINNKWVVPYNETLLRAFKCHCNVEIVASVKSVKYATSFFFCSCYCCQEEIHSDAIERVNLDSKTAYKRFKGTVLDASNADFSGRIQKQRNTGYDIIKNEYEMLEEGSEGKETPQQKYQRLQYEMRELTEEVTKVKESAKTDTNENFSPINLGKQLEYLHHQLADLHLEKLLGPEASVDLSDPQGALRKRLLTQLEAYSPASKPATATPSKGSKTSDKASEGKASDHVTYELYYRPEQAQFSKNAKFHFFQSALTAEVSNKSLLAAVSNINSKLSLLDPAQIDQVEARLQNVLQKVNQITEKKIVSDDSEKQAKVTELYEIVKKWESMADVLPQVVDRLTTLKDIHEQALQFSQALVYLDTAQQEIRKTLTEHGDMMKQLEDSFKQNTDGIKKNCQSLEERMKALKK